MKTKIELKTYSKRNQYNYFHTFPDPTYSFNVNIDVSEIVKVSKERKESFFPLFFYCVMRGVNDIKEMRLREENNEVFLYDVIHPTFTVMNDEGIYINTGCEMSFDYNEFYSRVRSILDITKKTKAEDNLDTNPYCKKPNVVFATCIPLISITSVKHPTPAYNYDSLSIPRILWDKYQKVDDKYFTMLNITVSHTLVDGYPLAECFKKIQNYAFEIKDMI